MSFSICICIAFFEWAGLPALLTDEGIRRREEGRRNKEKKKRNSKPQKSVCGRDPLTGS